MPVEWDRDVFGSDCSTPLLVGIVEFRDGFAKEFEVVRCFDDDDDDENDDEPSADPVSPLVGATSD